MKVISGNKIAFALGVSSVATLASVLMTGCVREPNGDLAFAPVVVASPPPVYVTPPPVYVAPAPPAPAVTIEVPDDYVWDGYEYVGVVGSQYYYLGAGGVWIVADPFRVNRFHDWERVHPDWHAHAIRNDRYRMDAHGHYQPRHDEH